MLHPGHLDQPVALHSGRETHRLHHLNASLAEAQSRRILLQDPDVFRLPPRIDREADQRDAGDADLTGGFREQVMFPDIIRNRLRPAVERRLAFDLEKNYTFVF